MHRNTTYIIHRGTLRIKKAAAEQSYHHGGQKTKARGAEAIHIYVVKCIEEARHNIMVRKADIEI